MSNRRVKAIKAEVARELKRLCDVKAGLRPSDVVDAARDKRSPLHGEFEWDDAKAGHEYRLMQARALIRVTLIESPGQPVDRYVHVPPTSLEAERARSQEGVYLPMKVVVSDVDLFARALSELTMKMRAAIRAAEELREVAQAHRGVDKDLLAKITLAMAALRTADGAIESLH